MATDPRPHTARRRDGTEDSDLETRFEVIFDVLKAPSSKRPTDEASMLTFLQELFDRMAGKQ